MRAPWRVGFRYGDGKVSIEWDDDGTPRKVALAQSHREAEFIVAVVNAWFEKNPALDGHYLWSDRPGPVIRSPPVPQGEQEARS